MVFAADTVHVIEASSFQLEGAQTFHPWVAVLLNFSPDHLDRLQRAEQRVVIGIRNRRRIEHVVAVRMLLELRTQGGGAGGRVEVGHAAQCRQQRAAAGAAAGAGPPSGVS